MDQIKPFSLFDVPKMEKPETCAALDTFMNFSLLGPETKKVFYSLYSIGPEEAMDWELSDALSYYRAKNGIRIDFGILHKKSGAMFEDILVEIKNLYEKKDPDDRSNLILPEFTPWFLSQAEKSGMSLTGLTMKDLCDISLALQSKKELGSDLECLVQSKTPNKTFFKL